MNRLRLSGIASLAIATTLLLAACGGKQSPGWEFARNMYDPIAYNPDQPNKNFKDGKTAQLPPANTMNAIDGDTTEAVATSVLNFYSDRMSIAFNHQSR